MPPASRNAISWAAASSGSVSRPQVMVPSAEPGHDQAAAAERALLHGANLVIADVPATPGSGRPRTAGCRDRRWPVEAAAGRVTGVRLGLNLGYWGAGNDADNLALAQEADRLGYAVVLGGRGVRLGRRHGARLGRRADRADRRRAARSCRSRPARPAMTAMTAATLDTLSGGRFRLGLGVSGPQVSEGWHGVRFAKPLARTREYVEIVRTGAAPARRSATRASTTRCRCPTARARRCKLTVTRSREHIPIYLAAVGPKNLELAGEIADGWLAIFFVPEFAAELARPDRAPAGPRPGKTMDGFDVVPDACRSSIGDDLAAPAPTRSAPYAALYIGGMGSREQNFYNQLAVRMGYDDAGRRGPGPVPGPRARGTRRPPCRSSSSTATSRCSGPSERIAERMRELRRGRGHDAVA